ncbi:MAG: rod shape-determining protein MreC [Candidatus Promineifilaceae bacterium]|nr:rod shape-determining protein MreC [Candidatus Promineifilaceae bacterium]
MDINDTQQRVRTTTILVLVGLTLVFLLLDSTGNLDSAFAFLRNPLSSVMGWTTARADAVADVFTGPRDVELARAQITQLEARVGELERENALLREQQSEYQVYRELFNRANAAPQYQRVTAEVIGRDTSPFFRSIIIDRGTADGVAPGMPVEGARGFVGQVYRASPQSAQIMLITDNVSNVPVRSSESRANGMLFGGGAGEPMVMDWIPLEAQVAEGDIVFTSGMGGQFPPDLIVGEVTEVRRSNADLFQQALIEPAEDLDDLEMVFVITSFESLDISVFDSPPEGIPQP